MSVRNPGAGSSGGSVASVNGQIGAVTLDAGDVGADVAGAAALAVPLTQRAAANGVATLDGTGQVPADQLANAAGAGAGTVTKRVSTPFGSDGVLTNTAASLDYNQRTLIQLPVTTSRWRVHFRNASGLSGAIQASSWDGTGIWVGTPLYSAAGLPWGRTFASAPAQAVGAFTTPSDGSDYVSPWVTDPALQFTKGVPRGLSTGIAHSASTGFYYSTQGWTYGGAGAAAAAGNATPGGAGLNNFVVGDWRLEYEYDTPAGPNGVPVGLFIGDSITAGWDSSPSLPASSPPQMQGFDPHQTWPGAAGMRNGFAWVNLGVGSTRAQQWATFSGWRWTRSDISTTVPDFAMVMLGTNDVFDGTAVATIQGYIQSVIATLMGLGIHEVWLATQIPRGFSGSSETLRTGLNAWIRNVPAGIAGVIDLDKALRAPATPSGMEPEYFGAYPHPNRAGYQAMGNATQRVR